ncbi:MAG TPA: hypothetical protein P5121_28675 [Caldilineaceae bacterium]|nr:hypothetical protein [Caldilineaceae bacterium]
MILLKRLFQLYSLWLSIVLFLLLHALLLFSVASKTVRAQSTPIPTPTTISLPLADPISSTAPSLIGTDAKPGLSQGSILTTPLIYAHQDRTVASLEGPLAADVAPVLTIWYGSTQSFGHLGNPQRWVNLLGNVTPKRFLASLVYSLNGAPPQPLSLGADKRRLAQDGDFNVELDTNALQDGVNTVVVTATNTSNEKSAATITLNYTAGTVWPLPYTTNWAGAASIHEVAQVVDGEWVREGGTIRPTWLDYDRLVGIGDRSWTDYEVVVPVTIHAVDGDDGFNPPSSGPGIGLLLRWQGHFQQASEQPRTGWQELGALGWFRWNRDGGGNIFAGLQLLGYYAGKEIAVDPTTVPAFETPYFLKMSVQTAPVGDIYRFKVWEQDQPEPAAWNMVAQGDANGPDSGSVLLVAHHIDASFGDVSVRPLSAVRPKLAVNAIGSGHVQIEPLQTDYAYGQVVTVTAVSESGFMLGSWSGDYQGQSNPLVLELTKDLAITATFTAATTPYSDDFNRCALAPNSAGWEWINPRSDATVQVNGQQAVVTVPGGLAHDAWSGGNFAPRLMQSAANGNLDLVAKFDSIPGARFQLQGILVEQDAANYLRFDFYHDGSAIRLHAAGITGGNAGTLYDSPLPGGIAGKPLYLRITRNGNQWTQAYSTDGATWSAGASFTQPLAVAKVGPFVGNAGNSAPAFTGIIDYFFNSAAPILPEDNAAVGPVITVIGEGTVDRAPTSAVYTCGQSVTLTATPAMGWRFAGWSGALTGMQNPTALTAATGQTITATFVKESYLLDLSKIGQGQLKAQPLMVAYPYGTVVTLTATAATDWRFAGWEGDLSGTTNPVQITMDGAKAVTAVFTTQIPTSSYELTTLVSGEGAVTRSPLGPQYPDGTTVTVTATAGIGWRFAGWEGIAGTSNPTTVIMTKNRVITATFVPIHHVVATAAVGNGKVTRSPDMADYPHGTVVTLIAEAAPGWLFAGWQGDGSGSQPALVLTVDRDLQLTATFVAQAPEQFSLITNSGEGGDIVLSPTLASYPAGTLVTMTAVPTTGWRFTGWGGDITGMDNPLQLTMNHAYAVQATFAPILVNFTTSVEGSGVISSTLPPGSYPYGTVVTLMANPASDHLFLGWAGDLADTQATTTLILDSDKHVTARFGRPNRTLNVQIEGQGTVEADVVAPYLHNQLVTLTATPNAGWRFAGWAGDGQGQQNPLALTMDSDKAVVATFVVDTSGTSTYSLYLPLVTR